MATPAPLPKVFSEAIASGILEALDLAILERRSDDRFALFEPVPRWLRLLLPETAASDGSMDLPEIFPFLDVFLPDCDAVWNARGAPPLQSDIWTEIGPHGEDRHLQALALRADDRPILILFSPSGAYHERSMALQRAHDVALESDKIERLS